MITFKHSGTFNKTERFMTRAIKHNPKPILNRYGRQGVLALAAATPKNTGETADAWDYNIKTTTRGYSLSWTNSNAIMGLPVVILIQYGHGVIGGGYVQGIDFINPALKPILEKLAQDISKEVSSL
jgi:hypothetical protein